MYEYLEGKIVAKHPEYVSVDINGVGYRVYISLQSYNLVEVENNHRLYIYNHIREDQYKLIGFTTEKERDLFEILINVNGIGVSIALAILSTFKVEEVVRIVNAEDIKSLTKVPKLGQKKAQKLVVDIKDKIQILGEYSSSEYNHSDDNRYSIMEEELYLALNSLGYSNKDIEKLVVREELSTYSDIGAAIKEILKKIQQGN